MYAVLVSGYVLVGRMVYNLLLSGNGCNEILLLVLRQCNRLLMWKEYVYIIKGQVEKEYE